MTATVGHSESDSQAAPVPPGSAARWAARFRPLHLVYALLFGGLFLYFNYLPLFHTDLWGHVAFGEWILRHRMLPTEDPWQPLAAGMRLIDSAWLGQVVLAAVHKLAGPSGLAVLFAALTVAAYGLLARSAVLATNNGWLGLLCVVLVIIFGWSRLMTLRPEVLGSFCFAAVLWLMAAAARSMRWEMQPRGSDGHGEGGTYAADCPVSRTGGRVPIWVWVLLPLVMMLWANLHGSFVCGLGLVACFAGGEALDAAWRLRSVWAPFAEPSVRAWILLAELSAAATLLNPYGMDLWIEVLRFSANENLRDITEWYPLVLASPTGVQFALAWLACVALVRFSPLRIRPFEVLAWGLFSTLVATSLRMIGWFAMVASVLLVRLLGAALRAAAASRQAARLATGVSPSVQPADGMTPEPGGTSGPSAPATRGHWYWCAATLFVLWITFALSDLARPVLGGAPRNENKLHSRQTPLALTAYLRENPPQGQVFNPQWWGDWLAYRGPSGMKLFVTTHVHLVPPRVYRDYTRVAALRDGWDEVLARYDVTTVIVDKELMQPLLAAMRQKSGWGLRYEDKQAAVFVRQGPRPAAAAQEGGEAASGR